MISERRSIDITEEEHIETFLSSGCGCKLGNNSKHCCLSFTKEDFRELRNNILELNESDRDMLVMGFLL